MRQGCERDREVDRAWPRGAGTAGEGVESPSPGVCDQNVPSSVWTCVECWMRTDLVIDLLGTSCVPSMGVSSSIGCLLCTRDRHVAFLKHLLRAGHGFCISPGSWSLQRYQFSHVAPPLSLSPATAHPEPPCHASRLPAAPQDWHDVTCPWDRQFSSG